MRRFLEPFYVASLESCEAADLSQHADNPPLRSPVAPIHSANGENQYRAGPLRRKGFEQAAGKIHRLQVRVDVMDHIVRGRRANGGENLRERAIKVRSKFSDHTKKSSRLEDHDHSVP